MAGNDLQRAPEITLLTSEIEAAAARVAEKAMNTTFDGVAGLVGDAFGGWIGDGIKQWRTRRLVTALAKTKDHLEKHGIAIEKAKPLPMGELFEIFEGASRTEDVDLTEMWAALLSNAMNPDKDASIDPSFVRILQSLSGLDARILSYNLAFKDLSQEHQKVVEPLYAQFRYDAKADDPTNQRLRHELRSLEGVYKQKAKALIEQIRDHYSVENISYSISNLLRLGLLYVPDILRTNGTLVKLKAHHFREEVLVDDEPLRRELDAIRRKFDIATEKHNELHSISENSRLMGNIPVPTYALSGLGRRFLEACT